MRNKEYDFSGWATRFNRKCSDGRTIKQGAFEHCDGDVVPLIYSHDHGQISSVVGNALLENRSEGVYAYCSFNNTRNGQDAKEMVRHGDIRHLSIYANHLTERGGDVFHGDIKEVSLVLAGANPGALIDVPYIEHGEDGLYDFEAQIYNDDSDTIVLSHSDKKKKKEDEEDDKNDDVKMEEKSNSEEDVDEDEEDVENDDDDDEEDEEEKKKKMKSKSIQHADDKTIQDVINTFNDEQKDVFYYVINELTEDDDEEDGDTDSTEGESGEMKHNVFDADVRNDNYLSHEDMKVIFSDAKRMGSLKEAVLAHEEEGVLAHIDDDDMPAEMTATYGIDRMNFLFPEARLVNNLPPEFIKRDMGWVEKVMNGTHHTPFSRIKSLFANITMDEARARGYLKGHLKKDEVFTLLRRTTDPQTIYKKQKMDRDDIIDITDFDVVSWLKSEMRMMLDEEIARAVLVGDGRNPADEDHISEEHVRPIWKDKELYSVKIPVTKGGDDMETAKNMIDASIRGRKEYKGSGQPTLFTTEDWIAEMLLLEDGINHKLYKSEAELATAMRVKEIVTVPVMEKLKDENGKELYGIIVNLSDYNIGADKGGQVNMFDDFDIDYNQQKYLIETRISGALIKPYSALVLQEA